MPLSTNMKKLIMAVHCVLTILLIAPGIWALYTTFLYGAYLTDHQEMSAIMLAMIAALLNFWMLKVFHKDILILLGDDK